jgi:hypothetical protein
MNLEPPRNRWDVKNNKLQFPRPANYSPSNAISFGNPSIKKCGAWIGLIRVGSHPIMHASHLISQK